MATKTASDVLAFSKLIGVLKHLKRTGWVKREVDGPETVAGHMYRMALLAFLLNDGSVDRDRCIRMALVHDLGEAIVGDITPHCGVSDQDKYEREKAAMERIAELVPNEVGKELVELWQEYEKGETAEARAVKQLDKFDMMAQAHEYEQVEGKSGRLEEFFSTAPTAFTTEPFLSWSDQLKTARKKE
uniref:5'-deoxynucleotidase HDDC2 n=1 Tax=Plectus sambesii TaxID=2011161 RepID=A0A914VYV6_9BILA